MKRLKLLICLSVLLNLLGCSKASESDLPSEAQINADAAKAYQDVKAKSKFSTNRQWNENRKNSA